MEIQGASTLLYFIDSRSNKMTMNVQDLTPKYTMESLVTLLADGSARMEAFNVLALKRMAKDDDDFQALKKEYDTIYYEHYHALMRLAAQK